ncbi:MAG: peptidoglycan DD-metalloendopeptidase family protein [Betaproteobacteria bacterium]|nr:peptidoglycan DD-metalloendopeptidase family protein [Betaproteobacteria bacterium]
MNKETFAKHLVMPVLAGVFVLSAGCTHQSHNAPVRDSSPSPMARTTPRPPPVETPVAQPGEYVVRQGDTLYAVSRMYGVPVNDLIAWNKLSRPGQLEVGQTLRVAAPETVAVPLASEQGMQFEAASLPEVKHEPRGGKEPWSEDAWARVQQPQTAYSAPSATISRPEFSAPESGVPESGTPESGAPRSGASGPSASEDWMWPVKGTIISGFDTPLGGDGKMRNRGVDIAGAPGTPILAAAGGKVVYAGDAVRGLGKMVIIKHNDEYLTAYAHNRVILVKEEDTVTRGQKIAELGSTDADRPKLHFELRKQGQPVDPLKYLPDL